MKTNAFKDFSFCNIMPEVMHSKLLCNGAYDNIDNEALTYTNSRRLNCDCLNRDFNSRLNCDSKMIAVINMIKCIKNHINHINLAKTCIERSRNII
ncbi:MAG: hypothetical protein LBR67_04180, partial [Dysgonamonadaceae bacterium]|nr:hypothetical protein [Dysgonamonadaceae bacterium]